MSKKERQTVKMLGFILAAAEMTHQAIELTTRGSEESARLLQAWHALNEVFFAAVHKFPHDTSAVDFNNERPAAWVLAKLREP